MGHSFVCGRTGEGKTNYVLVKAEEWPGPVFFFNPQEEDTPSYFTECDRRNNLVTIRQALLKGKKLNYIPHPDDILAAVELDILIKTMFVNVNNRINWPGLLFIADESQDFAPEGKRSPLQLVARRGRKRGITAYFMSQSPADVSKVLVKQCSEHIIFGTSFEGPYFDKYRIDSARVTELINAGGQFSFVIYDGVTIEGPHKVKLAV